MRTGRAVFDMISNTENYKKKKEKSAAQNEKDWKYEIIRLAFNNLQKAYKKKMSKLKRKGLKKKFLRQNHWLWDQRQRLIYSYMTKIC